MTDPITIARAQAAIENGLIEALQSQAQADMDGTTVIVSRQACDEAAEFLPALYDEVKRLRADLTDGSFYKETDIDRLQERAEKAEAERDRLRTQCCMCGKTGLSTIEDGGQECELDDGRWVCSVDCYDRAVLNPLEAEAERDALRVALIDHNDLLRSAMQICSRAIQHEEFRVLANWDAFHDRISVCLKRHHATSNDARAALKGTSE